MFTKNNHTKTYQNGVSSTLFLTPHEKLRSPSITEGHVVNGWLWITINLKIVAFHSIILRKLKQYIEFVGSGFFHDKWMIMTIRIWFIYIASVKTKSLNSKFNQNSQGKWMIMTRILFKYGAVSAAELLSS
jgi:hypothetical protein